MTYWFQAVWVTLDKSMLKQGELPCAGLQSEDVLSHFLNPRPQSLTSKPTCFPCHHDPIWPKTKAQPLSVPPWASGEPWMLLKHAQITCDPGARLREAVFLLPPHWALCWAQLAAVWRASPRKLSSLGWLSFQKIPELESQATGFLERLSGKWKCPQLSHPQCRHLISFLFCNHTNNDTELYPALQLSRTWPQSGFLL